MIQNESSILGGSLFATSNPDLEAIRNSVRDFVTRNAGEKLVRETRFQTPGSEIQMMRDMHGLGWCAMRIPEAYGGLGLGLTEMAVVLSELGKGLLAGPMAATAGLAVGTLIAAPESDARDSLLRSVAQGDTLPALAWQEQAGECDVDVCECSAVRDANSAESIVRLNGVKRLIVGAAASQVYLVTARTQAGVALYAIDRHAPGLVEEQEWHADGTPATRLILSDVVVASSNLIIDETRSIAAIQSAIADATVMASAELFGLMSRLLEMTIDYMKIRVQFGRPIGAFQALQHKAVDLLILQALTASVVGEGCSSMAHLGLGQRRMLAARVKARASDAALKIAREAVQLHGAIAIQDECDVGLYLKRIMTVAAWSGNASVQRKLYASLNRDAVQKSESHSVVRV